MLGHVLVPLSRTSQTAPLELEADLQKEILGLLVIQPVSRICWMGEGVWSMDCYLQDILWQVGRELDRLLPKLMERVGVLCSSYIYIVCCCVFPS